MTPNPVQTILPVGQNAEILPVDDALEMGSLPLPPPEGREPEPELTESMAILLRHLSALPAFLPAALPPTLPAMVNPGAITNGAGNSRHATSVPMSTPAPLLATTTPPARLPLAVVSPLPTVIPAAPGQPVATPSGLQKVPVPAAATPVNASPVAEIAKPAVLADVGAMADASSEGGEEAPIRSEMHGMLISQRSQPSPTPAPVANTAPATPQQVPQPPMPSQPGKGDNAYLQVPFNNGQFVGQISVAKPGADFFMPAAAPLHLTPSNAELASHLRQHIGQLPQPGWLLKDGSQGQSGQQQQGEEAEELAVERIVREGQAPRNKGTPA